MRSVRSFLDSLLAVESMRYKNLGQRNCGMEDPTQRSACFAERRTCLVRGEGLCRARRGEGCQGRGDGKTWRSDLASHAFHRQPGTYGDAVYRFEWEREWRVPGGFQFEVSEVQFLYLPEADHVEARSFFQQVLEENSGTAYLCPYIDPGWDVDRLRKAIRAADTQSEGN